MIEVDAPARRKPGRAPMPETARRHLLTEAAAEVFMRDGYAAASMDDVARAAGMSKRTLYQYFPSKAALFEATVAAALAPLHVASELEADPDLGRALRGMLQAAAAHLFALRQTGIFRLVISEVNRSPELAEATHRVLFNKGAGSLQRRIAAEVARGNIRLQDEEAAARMLFGMALGATHFKLLLGVRGEPDAAEVATLARAAVDVFLHGALRREAV
ncbi:TetR/AcrR family transcriptional regulator [Falsiroseomonas tokyonensis]|uniref:TetR/AcrR family transcriptional regulator n=1 Tax=Falsiroseomonas tokyonensis TaxID=430521 RepID=A0ABV7C434_9PROT|nr:TetR/AcrR family transcriptional regulator [Falsiroseomonas tokyonensis]MBU8541057.1 TetR/AcrR family transcriptional regulator [Falsiroseomonas tokyonensis]